MHHFDYRDGVLHAEGVSLVDLADAVGTPFYCYSTATLERHYRVFADAFADVPALVCYAMKANSNQAVIATLARLGAGADVVSGGELKRARAAGVPAGQDHVLRRRQDRRARWRWRSTRASSASTSSPTANSTGSRRSRAARAARVDISLRVNPDVDAKTHAKIATGKSENKFGIPISRAREVYARAARLPGLRVTGVDMHIGSQIIDLRRSTMRSRCWPSSCASCAPTVTSSAMSISAAASASPIARTTSRRPIRTPMRRSSSAATRDLGCKLIFEPGRLLVGNAGILVTRVLYVKHGEAKTFVIVDAGDERPDPPDAVRGAPRHPAGASSRDPARRACAPMWSARSVNPAISSPSTANCRRWRWAICWRS